MLLCYGLSVPFLMAIAQGWHAGDIVRDGIGFLFFLMPVLLYVLIASSEERQKNFIVLLIVLASAFSIRALIPELGGLSSAEAYWKKELHYYENSPVILFAALLSFGCAMEQILKGRLINGTVCLLLTALCITPIILTLQRASLAVFLIFIILSSAVLLTKYPRRVILLGIAILVIITCTSWLQSPLEDIIQNIEIKNRIAGLNSRLIELRSVWYEIKKSYVTLFFGKGWGATFFSPAAGGVYASYTHGLLSSMLLKTGLVGVLLSFLFLSALLMNLFFKITRHPLLIMAIAGPLMISIFLYGSYKSLDFGLLLTLAALITAPVSNKFPVVRMQKPVRNDCKTA